MNRRKWYWAVPLTFLLPGLGHMYAGRLARGAVLFAAVVLATVLAYWLEQFNTSLRVVSICLQLAVFLFVLIDSWLVCGKGEFVAKQYNKWYFYCLAILLGFWVSGLADPRYRLYRIPSESMAKTIIPGDRVYVDKTYYKQTEPQVGDIVVMRCPPNRDLTYIKRIAAGPGDQVECDGADFRVNGLKLDVYAHAPAGQRVMHPDRIKYVLPPGKYFVLGDNFDHSAMDSRFFGPIGREDILGRPLYIYYSPDFSRIGRNLS